MINAQEPLHWIIFFVAAFLLVRVHIGTDEDYPNIEREVLAIRRTAQVIALLLLCGFAGGCADVKVVAPRAATAQQDGHYVYADITSRRQPQPHAGDEPIGIACEPDPTHQYPCRAPADDEFVALSKLHEDWVVSHTVTIPVGKCIWIDLGTTGIGYLAGFHEGGAPIIIKAALTWWQIQASAAAARQGDLSIAEITALTHCSAGGLNVMRIARIVK